MSAIHIIHGFIAFGKTTLAKKLESESHSIHLNTDEWIGKLYGKNLSEKSF